jgi:hypothetical protein
MNAKNKPGRNLSHDLEMGDDLVITKQTRRVAVGGTWVTGKLNGHTFHALVFPEHAECERYELDDSRISKLWLQRTADKKEVANFDRGWDRRPEDAIAKAIVGFLAAGLAEHVFGQ